MCCILLFTSLSLNFITTIAKNNSNHIQNINVNLNSNSQRITYFHGIDILANEIINLNDQDVAYCQTGPEANLSNCTLGLIDSIATFQISFIDDTFLLQSIPKQLQNNIIIFNTFVLPYLHIWFKNWDWAYFPFTNIDSVDCMFSTIINEQFVMYQIGPQAILSNCTLGLIDIFTNFSTACIGCRNPHFSVLTSLFKKLILLFGILVTFVSFGIWLYSIIVLFKLLSFISCCIFYFKILDLVLLFLYYNVNHGNFMFTGMIVDSFMMYQIGPQAILSFYAMGLIDMIINFETIRIICNDSHFLILFKLLKSRKQHLSEKRNIMDI